MNNNNNIKVGDLIKFNNCPKMYPFKLLEYVTILVTEVGSFYNGIILGNSEITRRYRKLIDRPKNNKFDIAIGIKKAKDWGVEKI